MAKFKIADLGCIARSDALGNHGSDASHSMSNLPQTFSEEEIWVGYPDKPNVRYRHFESWASVISKCEWNMRNNIPKDHLRYFPRTTTLRPEKGHDTRPVHCVGCCSQQSTCEEMTIEFHPVTVTVGHKPVTQHVSSFFQRYQTIRESNRCLQTTQLPFFMFWCQGERLAALMFHRSSGVYCFQKRNGEEPSRGGLINSSVYNVNASLDVTTDPPCRYSRHRDLTPDNDETEGASSPQRSSNIQDAQSVPTHPPAPVYRAYRRIPTNDIAQNTAALVETWSKNIDDHHRNSPIHLTVPDPKIGPSRFTIPPDSDSEYESEDRSEGPDTQRQSPASYHSAPNLTAISSHSNSSINPVTPHVARPLGPSQRLTEILRRKLEATLGSEQEQPQQQDSGSLTTPAPHHHTLPPAHKKPNTTAHAKDQQSSPDSEPAKPPVKKEEDDDECVEIPIELFNPRVEDDDGKRGSKRRKTEPTAKEEYARILAAVFTQWPTAARIAAVRHIIYEEMAEAVTRNDCAALYTLHGRLIAELITAPK